MTIQDQMIQNNMEDRSNYWLSKRNLTLEGHYARLKRQLERITKECYTQSLQDTRNLFKRLKIHWRHLFHLDEIKNKKFEILKEYIDNYDEQ